MHTLQISFQSIIVFFPTQLFTISDNVNYLNCFHIAIPGGEQQNWPKAYKQKRHAAAAKSLQSCPTLCNPINSSPPGSSAPWILQARILEWIAISFSSTCMHARSLQLYPTLHDPMDSSPPDSCVQRILQARIVEWVAISFSKISHEVKANDLGNPPFGQ